MTEQDAVTDNSKYRKIHNHGFVGLIDVMGSDSDIADAARVSYGSGTKTISDDRNLVRYLVRHKHTSPLEMAEVKFHLKLPIFVMRQLVRHRTANLNEYSGRYSEMSNEFYMPEPEYLAPQSTTNKQGRDGELTTNDKMSIRGFLYDAFTSAYEGYKCLLGKESNEPILITGLSRELARIVMPVANYTECYWKCDLHNFFHLCKLRIDKHAQKEIVDFAEVE